MNAPKRGGNVRPLTAGRLLEALGDATGVLIGDSLTIYGVDMVTAQDGFTLYLERALRWSNPTHQIEAVSR